jgi:predicted porin
MAVVKSSQDGESTTAMFGATNEFSNVTFRGVADAGMGLKAEAFIDLGLYDRAGGAQFTRELYVGLKSEEAGSLRLGRQLTPLFLAAATNEVNGAPAAAGGLEGVLAIVLVDGVRDARRDGTIQYVSPSFAGITANVQSTQANTILEVGTGYGYGLSYSAGAFAAQYQVEMTKDESILDYIAQGAAAVGATTDGDTTTRSVFAASYNFGMARAHYMHGTAKHTALDVKGDYYGISVPMGAFTLTGSIYTASSNDGAATSKANGTLYKLNYALSKKTNAYIISGQDKFTTADSKLTTNSFGISHAF